MTSRSVAPSRGELIRKHACKLGFEGVVSKTRDAPYAPGNRGVWRKAKCLNRQDFVIVGWTDPEGSRRHLGALLLGYCDENSKLIYAGRVGTGIPDKVLADLRRRFDPLARATMPLDAPPRKTRFGPPLVLSRVALGRAATCRRDHLSDLDCRRAPATRGLSWTPIRQARNGCSSGSPAQRVGIQISSSRILTAKPRLVVSPRVTPGPLASQLAGRLPAWLSPLTPHGRVNSCLGK
jgi:ATP dependent DNA ligase C terminal region